MNIPTKLLQDVQARQTALLKGMDYDQRLAALALNGASTDVTSNVAFWQMVFAGYSKLSEDQKALVDPKLVADMNTGCKWPEAQ